MKSSWGHLKSSCSHLRPSDEELDTISDHPGHLLKHPNTKLSHLMVLSRFKIILNISWAVLGPLAAVQARFGLSYGRLETILSCLALSWAVSGLSRGHLGPSCSHIGAVLSHGLF